VLIHLLESLAAGDDRTARALCTEKGWGDLEADKYLQIESDIRLQPAGPPPIERWRGHFQRLLPLREADVKWRQFGTNYCSALVFTQDPAGEGFLFTRQDGEWKFVAYSSIGPIEPRDDMIVK